MMSCLTASAEEPLLSDPVISAVDVEISDYWGNKNYWTELADDLIRISPGTPFSETILQTAIDALKQSNKFESVHIDSVEENNQMTLRFFLKPYNLIRDIRFSGLYPLFEKDVLNAMTVFIGDVFIEDSLDEQKRLIENLYKNEGFISPDVQISKQTDPKNRHVILEVIISKGAWFSSDTITISGNTAFSDSRLKMNMKTWRHSLIPGMMGRFSAISLKSDIETLSELYRSRQFADVVIDYSVETDVRKKTAAVFIKIDEGRRYVIQFEGNKAFWNFTLKKDIRLFQERNINDIGIRKSISDMESRYRQAGYVDASVTFTDQMPTQGSDKIRVVRFIIKEGPRSKVDSVSISGNDAVPDKLIQKEMLTRKPSLLHSGAYVPSTLKEDTDAVRALYLERGYMAPEIRKETVLDSGTHKASVLLEIDEGVQTVISSLSLQGLTVISEEEALKVIRLKPGEPYREYMVKSDENSLAALISKKGYPHVRVTGNVVISGDTTSADIIYDTDEGGYAEMGEVYYSGNFKTRDKYLNRELKIRPGDPFSLAELLDTQRNLRNMNIFNSIQFRTVGVKEKADRVNLFVEMEEKKPYYIEVGSGYDTSRHFYAHVRGGSHNLFGTVKDAWISGEISQIGYRADTGILEPRLFGTDIAASFSVFAEQTEQFNQYFGASVYGTSLGFSRKLSERISAALNFRFEQRNQYWIRPDIVEKEEIGIRNIFITSPGLTYDSRDSFVSPTKGAYAAFAVDLSKGIDNTMDDFLKYRLDARYYITPINRLTLACAVRAGYLDPYSGSRTAPDDQLFYLGGITDVRGFQENMLQYDRFGKPVGGRQSASGSLEARIDIGYNFELTGFYDIGRISEAVSDDDPGFRSSVGAGIRYKTPIGPVSFVYGFKLDPREDESAGRFHFSLGYTF